MEIKPGITFCICTFNRVAYLKKCIESLLPQLIPGKSILMVVDNKSTDTTKELVNTFMDQNYLIQYIYEENQGLSHARNRGWKDSEFEWIFYIDDDCLVPRGLVDEAFDLVENSLEVALFGGPIDPIFISSAPDWTPTGFGSFSMPFKELKIIETGFLRGGCFLIRKSVATSLGGFNEQLGMKGNTLRYGEEIELQSRIRNEGLNIAYAPKLRMRHFVRDDKLNLRWVLYSEYARRRDRMFFDRSGIAKGTIQLLRTLMGRLIWIPVHLFRFITIKKYSWRHAMIDSFIPLAYRLGELKGILQNKLLK